MEIYAGYIFIFILILLLLIIFGISICIETKNIKFFLKKELEKAELTKMILKKNCYYPELIEKNTKDFPFISKYLSQIITIASIDVYDFKKIEIEYIKPSKIEEFDLNSFLKEFRRCKAEIKNELLAVSSILERIYKINHPLKYKINKFKKNIHLQILALFIKILSIIPNIVDKFDEKFKILSNDIPNDIHSVHKNLSIKIV